MYKGFLVSLIRMIWRTKRMRTEVKSCAAANIIKSPMA